MADGNPEQTLTIAGALVVALPAAGALVRSGLKILASALQRSSKVIEENSAAFAKLTEWLGRVDVRTQDAHGRVVEIHREISDVYDVPGAPHDPPSGEWHDEGPTPVDSPAPRRKKAPRAQTHPKAG